MKFFCIRSRYGFAPVVRNVALSAFILAWPARVLAAGEQQFASPDAAVKALAAAAGIKDTNALHAIFGPAARELVSPDAVQRAAEFAEFAKRLAEKTELVRQSDSRMVLQLGTDGWPFPIPLVKQGEQWHFDTIAGKEEVHFRYYDLTNGWCTGSQRVVATGNVRIVVANASDGAVYFDKSY